MRFYPPQAVVSPLKLLRRERMMPAHGEILVQQGARVDPVQVIGRVHARGEFRIVDVAHSLGVPIRKFQRYLQVKTDQEVKKGQVLARRRGLFGLGRKLCRSPIDGRVTGSGHGKLLIEGQSQEIEVRAGYYGTVTRIYPGRGVAIQIAGAIIQGAWGNGKEGFGVMRLTVKARNKSMKARAIDTTSRGVILVGGSSLDSQALERAIELQARGIIVGSIAPELIEEVTKLPFPVVATEGIGAFPMSAPAFDLLSTHNGREAILDGRLSGGREGQRPEIIIPLPAEPGTDALKLEEKALAVGDRVRAVRAPHIGLTGTVVALPPAAMRIATGARLPVARIRPDDEGEPVLIPVNNLEMLP